MKPMVKVYLTDDAGEKFFGEGPYRLLLAVEKTGSLRQAAAALEMAYTKALKILARAEETLGYPLLTRAAGGRSGGGSRLTKEGVAWMAQFERYRASCKEAGARIYREVFEGGIGCVIMASGLGKRFGGNKLLADFDGQPMICRILDATEGLFARRVVVTRHEAVAALCRARHIPVVVHDLPHRSDTVRLGLDALGDDLDGCLFCPADQPLLTRETIQRLASFGSTGEICRLSFDSQMGTPILFPKWCFPELRALPEGKGGSFLVKKYPHRVLAIAAREACELRDVDTPEDLKELAQYIAQREG